MGTSHSITISGLSLGTSYHFRVRSTDASSNIGSSADQTLTTLWMYTDSMLDADFANSRYWYNSSTYADENALLTAVSGSKSGITRTIDPKVIGSELVSNPSLDSDVSGYVLSSASDYATFSSTTWNAGGGNGRLQVNRTTGGTNFTRFGIAVTTVVGKAYQFGTRPAESYGVGGANINFHSNNLFGNNPGLSAPFTGGTQYLGYAPSVATTMYVGSSLTATAPWIRYFDDFTVKEVIPLIGHNYLALSGTIKGTTPSAASGNKVIFQADGNNEANRIRLVYDNSGNLHFMVTRDNSAQADLDLGAIAVSTSFEVSFSSSANNFKASLNGGSVVSDTAGSHPGIAYIRIGRSFTGETWDGGIDRVTLYNSVLSDLSLVDGTKAFAVYGDSTAHGDGAATSPEHWDAQLSIGYSPDRSLYNASVSGENSTQLKDHVLADTTHLGWTTIFMDLPNTGESAATWVANIKTAAAHLTTSRWFVVPPVQNSPGGAVLSSSAAITTIQSTLQSDSDFLGHTFNSTDQATYISTMNDDAMRSDFTHFNEAGQDVQTNMIRTTLDSFGW